MKQIGNLAIVCAQRPDVLMQIYGGTVSIHAAKGRSGPPSPLRGRMTTPFRT